MKYYKQRFHLMTFAWATTLVAAACFYCAAEKPADTKLPVKAANIQGNTLYASGQDQTVALQNLYAQAHDGDTIVLQPLYGQQFVFSGSVSWDAGKLVNIEATGAVISGGTNTISWGSPTGSVSVGSATSRRLLVLQAESPQSRLLGNPPHEHRWRTGDNGR